MDRELHIGDLIRKKLKDGGQKEEWLAKQINCQNSNISKIFKKPSLNSDLLLEISVALEENIHQYYTDIYHDKMLKKKKNQNRQNKCPNWTEFSPNWTEKLYN